MTDNKRYNMWQVEMVVPLEDLPVFESALEEYFDVLLMSEIEKGENAGKWKVGAINNGEIDEAKLSTLVSLASIATGIDEPKIEITEVEDKDWLKESLISFPPVTAGRYYIYGSHIKEAPPADKTPIMINAATAFGSGEHQTTKGCLLAIDDFAKYRDFNNVLDMGCGSGILSIAAAKSFKCPVLAVDIDEESVRVTTENAEKNGVSDYIKTETGDGYKSPSVNLSAPYDLIVANILARPLTEMAEDLAANLAPDGVAVISGLLVNQESWVLEAHQKHGLKLVKHYRENDWSALVIKHN